MSEPVESIEPPAALVLGCNTPHGIGVLSDWIEEQTGTAPDFAATGWSDGRSVQHDGNGFGYGTQDGAGRGNGFGYGNTGAGNGNGGGHGYTLWDGDGRGCQPPYDQ